MNRFRPSSLTVVLGLLSSVAAASQVGTVLFSRGDVVIVDSSGASRPATRGAIVQDGERLVAPQGAVSQIKLNDGSLIGVRPGTEFRFELPARASDQARHVVSLVQGGLRVINLDQADGKAHRPVLLQTRAGDVTLPGGDVESFFVPPNPRAGERDDGGSYTRLISGAGTVRSGNVEMPLTVRTVAFVPKPEVAPKPTTSFSSTMFVTPVFTTALVVATAPTTTTTSSPTLATAPLSPTTTLSGTTLSTTSLTTTLSPTTSTLTSPTLLTSTSLSSTTPLAPTTAPLSTTNLSLSTISPTRTTSPTTTTVTYTPPPTITYVPPPPTLIAPTIKTTTIKCTTLRC